jgi:DNA polymerase-3 subunit epsilon
MKRLVIDTETTGLSPNYNKTLTVGMLLVEVEKQHLKILDSNHIFIKHKDYNASSQALKINGIDLEEHDKIAIPPKKACNEINLFLKRNILQETPLVGHNLSFDKRFLNALFDQGESLHKFHHESEDTMFIWRSLQNRGKIPGHLRSNLGTVASFFDIDYEKSHDALADCHITAKVYRKLLKL